MRAICAWCADEPRAGESVAAVLRSHGLCAPCLSARLELLPATHAPVDRAPLANLAEQEAA